ncbi:hypothetical protein OEZ85_012753 [Tetradesmus obliquus]|uniref:Uncharacterized protein n=1 Tax=Tetradesmus obliquus TaxID=3088 RepID=A0ABY8U7P0_TETOB|nr:hypothetical protein OEZ85_012753 [Tetradesmus obliquus]
MLLAAPGGFGGFGPMQSLLMTDMMGPAALRTGAGNTTITSGHEENPAAAVIPGRGRKRPAAQDKANVSGQQLRSLLQRHRRS